MAVGWRSVAKFIIIIPSSCLHTDHWLPNTALPQVPAAVLSQTGQTRENLQEKGLAPGNPQPGLQHPQQHHHGDGAPKCLCLP